MGTKGFTLIESMLIILIVSIIMAGTPMIIKHKSVLIFQMEYIKDFIVSCQTTSINNRNINEIVINKSFLKSTEKEINLNKNITCDEYFLFFNGKGNINMANSISCYYFGYYQTIVFNLGNGSIYVK